MKMLNIELSDPIVSFDSSFIFERFPGIFINEEKEKFR